MTDRDRRALSLTEAADRPPLTVTEAAIIDLERQKEAILARARNFDPKRPSQYEAGDLRLTPDYVEALTRPVRIEPTTQDYWDVYCEGCAAATDIYPSESAAIAAWNRRAGDSDDQ